MNVDRAKFSHAMLGGRDTLMEEILRWSLLQKGMPTIQIDDATGKILQMLTLLQRPLRVIEIGTLFGYSTIYIARGLPPDGRIVTLEKNEEAAYIAKINLEKAGVSDKVDVIVCDALEYLKTVAPRTIDMIFIDGQKEMYPKFLKLVYPLLQSGGLLIADDAYAGGNYSADYKVSVEPGNEKTGILTYVSAVSRIKSFFSAFLPTENGLLISFKE